MTARRSLALATAAAATLAGTGGALACPPVAALGGDEPLVRAVDALLRARGISAPAEAAAHLTTLAEAEVRCPAVRARVERRGDAIAVVIVDPGGARIERVVGEAATAATVIESFVRADVGAPLLARREAPAAAVRADVRVPDEGPPRSPEAARHPTTSGTQLFAGIETSVATDDTNWMGFSIGACISLGPICAAARLREAAVVAGPGVWDTGALRRESTTLFVGIDVPLSLGAMTLSPGFAAGVGVVRTEMRGAEDDLHDGTAGLRADVHATLTVPLRRRLALDLMISADIAQETTVRWRSELEAPDDSLLIVRFGAGLRYGGL